ncbi:hypothetical protein [Arthrobacter psychrolactophilus]
MTGAAFLGSPVWGFEPVPFPLSLDCGFDAAFDVAFGFDFGASLSLSPATSREGSGNFRAASFSNDGISKGSTETLELVFRTAVLSATTGAGSCAAGPQTVAS